MTATDRNGNRLAFSDQGITSDSGRSIQIDRDLHGRIRTITDPVGGEFHYTYDAIGNLRSATDRSNITTSYGYTDSARPHFLTEIRDPLDRPQTRVAYDDQGRLVRTIDVNGNATHVGNAGGVFL